MDKFEIGINLRATECLKQSTAGFATYCFEKCPDKPDSDRIEFAYFGVFDGYGGLPDAARFAKANLLNEIKKVKGFWSTDDNAVLQAIKKGFINTHNLMWNERANWPKTDGYDSIAGTTASIAIVRNRKLYIGHVGDSAVVLGCKLNHDLWKGQKLTVDHRPGDLKERCRIERAGGWVKRKYKGGVHCVMRRYSDERGTIVKPYLPLSRSLGHLWSFNKFSNQFDVSPEPDVQCVSLDYTRHKCLVVGSDGLWSRLRPDSAVEMVRVCERSTELKVFTDPEVPANFSYNPSASLVHMAMQHVRADVRADITALVVMLDPPGRPMSQLRCEQREQILCRLGVGCVANRDSVKNFLVQCDNDCEYSQPAAVGAASAAAPAAADESLRQQYELLKSQMKGMDELMKRKDEVIEELCQQLAQPQSPPRSPLGQSDENTPSKERSPGPPPVLASRRSRVHANETAVL